jgi:NDP-sugar pyrophosphorylase family protein
VLAAGMGSRYGGLKQISRFGPSGETILEYSIYDALRAGFGKVVIVVRKHFEHEFRDRVVGRAMKKADISFVYQELDNIPASFEVPAGREKPWGTAHAVLIAKDAIHEPFAVINADDFYGYSAYRVLGDFLSKQQENAIEEYCLVDYLLKNTLSQSGSVARGICQVDQEGYLTDIIENKNIYRTGDETISEMPGKTKIRLTGNEHVSMNMMGFLPSFFKHLHFLFDAFLRENISDLRTEFYLPFALNYVIKQGYARVRLLSTDARWFGVTYADDKEEVVKNLHNLVNEGVYPQDLWV